MGLLTLPPSRMDILVPMIQSSECRPTGVGKLTPVFQTYPRPGNQRALPQSPTVGRSLNPPCL